MESWINFLVEPLQYEFMRKAFLGLGMASVSCAVVGAYVVLRRMAFIGEAMTHTLLPGVVIAYLLGVNLLLGGLVGSLVTAVGIGWLSGRREIHEDVAIGVVLSVMFAVGVLLVSTFNAYRDFSLLLFGSVLGVSGGDLVFNGVVAGVVFLVLGLFHKELVLSSYDEVYSEQIHIRPRVLRYVVLILVSISVVSGVRLVGALLTTALMIIPGAVGVMLGRSVRGVMGYGVMVGLISSIVGLYLSYYLNWGVGGSVVVVAGGIFLGTYLWRSIRERDKGQ